MGCIFLMRMDGKAGILFYYRDHSTWVCSGTSLQKAEADGSWEKY